MPEIYKGAPIHKKIPQFKATDDHRLMAETIQAPTEQLLVKHSEMVGLIAKAKLQNHTLPDWEDRTIRRVIDAITTELAMRGYMNRDE